MALIPVGSRVHHSVNGRPDADHGHSRPDWCLINCKRNIQKFRAMSEQDLVEQVRIALESEPRIQFRQHPVMLGLELGALVMDGDFINIAAKKLALVHAAALPAVTAIIDRAHTIPATVMGDSEIRDHLINALVEESVFHECNLTVQTGEKREVIQQPPGEVRGSINVSVVDGVVMLDGEAPSLSHKRLAGVFAWWIPGSRDVVNGLGVEPEEQDNDDEITDAVRLVLEKDPLVNASDVAVTSKHYIVTLAGIVPTESEREMAEFDVWYVFGVDRVINLIEVRPPTAQTSK
jgi:osmotically-inducible protein OsmY